MRRADDGGRTRDLKLGKLALYQLSYVRVEVILRRGRGAGRPWDLVFTPRERSLFHSGPCRGGRRRPARLWAGQQGLLRARRRRHRARPAAAPARGWRDRLAGRLPGPLGAGQLLGLVVHPLPGGGAGAGGLPAAARRSGLHRARGRHPRPQRGRPGLHARIRGRLPAVARRRRRRRPRIWNHGCPGELPGRPAGEAAPARGRPGRRGVPERTGGAAAARRFVVMARLALVAALALALLAPAAGAAERASLIEIEKQVMCPVCGTLLQLAESPQAQRERVFINRLIDEGKSEAEIKDTLVAEYGDEVLALPPDSGFSLSAYLVPIVAFLIAVVALAIGVLRWRRAGGDDDGPAARAAGPSGEDSKRLDADLARYDL